MEDISPSAPSRQHTIESQRQRQPLPSTWRRFLEKFGASSQPSGPVDDAIEAGARRYSRNAQSFLNDFGHMSRRPKARLHEIFQFFLQLPYTTAESNDAAAESIETAAGSTETETRSNTMASAL